MSPLVLPVKISKKKTNFPFSMNFEYNTDSRIYKSTALLKINTTYYSFLLSLLDILLAKPNAISDEKVFNMDW